MQKSNISNKYSLNPLLFFIILLCLYLLSFVTGLKRNSPKSVKTALMNAKYEQTLSSFDFQTGETQLYFQKKGDIWYVNNTEEVQTFIPADSQKVNLLLKDLTKVISLYKISDKNDSNPAFQFNNSNAFTINYENYSICFGNYDFSQTYRYLTTSSSDTVYQISTELDKYLTTSVLAWSEPYILSRQFINVSPETIQSISVSDVNGVYKKHRPGDENYKDNVFSFMELRNGGIVSDFYEYDLNDEPAQLQLALECGDKSEIIINILKTPYEAEYIVKTEYKAAQKNSECVIYEKISSWTYNRIREMML